jgi:hypothetical protein
MRNFQLLLAVAALVSGSAFAADTSSSPLAPGKPAGLRTAQQDDTPFYIIGLGAIAVGVAVLASDNGHNNTPNTTPSTQ